MNAPGDRWLAFAREDLQVAELALEAEIFNQVCFHSQQCVEKCLKAMLSNLLKVPPRTHSIADLLGLLPPECFSDLRDDLSQMDLFCIPTRYPDALPGSLPEALPGREEAEEAIATARAALARCLEDGTAGHLRFEGSGSEGSVQ